METKNNNKRSFFQRYRWLLLILLMLGGGGAYYIYQQSGGNFDFSDSFTRYRQFPSSNVANDSTVVDSLADIPPMTTTDTLPPDTIVAASVPDSFLGFALPIYDSLPPIHTDDAVVDSIAITDSLARLAEGQLETLPDTLTPALAPTITDKPVASASSSLATPILAEDIFDGLLPTAYQSPGAEETFLTSYRSNTISTRGAYKLVSIAGKSFLLRESPEALEMLNTLVDEDAIAAISVSDRRGRILYASNPRERGRLITDVYTDLPVSNEAINWMRQDGRTITGIPIFSVGGRLGTVFVVTQ